MKKIKLFLNVIFLFFLLLFINNFLLHHNKNELINGAESEMYSVLNPEFKMNLKINMQPIGLCNFKTKFIFIYVFTSVKSFAKRQLIRETWANKSLLDFNLVFIIGKYLKENATITKLLEIEQNKYNDLVQGNFIDSYRNLSYKSLVAWKWIKNNCDQASFVLKLDDDILLNTFKLKNILDTNFFHDSMSNSFICRTFYRAGVIRSENSKWFANYSEYNLNLYNNVTKSDSEYPTYCVGVAVILTTDIISRLYMKALEIKMFWIDDVYVGILGNYINAQFKNIDNFYLYSGDLSKLNENLFIYGADSNENTYKIWSLIKNNNNS